MLVRVPDRCLADLRQRGYQKFEVFLDADEPAAAQERLAQLSSLLALPPGTPRLNAFVLALPSRCLGGVWLISSHLAVATCDRRDEGDHNEDRQETEDDDVEPHGLGDSSP